MRINIDLLPKERKLELKRNKLFRKILGEELLFLFPVIVFIVILCNIYYLLYSQRNNVVQTQLSSQSQDSLKELNKYEEKFKEVNENSAMLIKIQEGHLRWSRVLEKMNLIVPEGMFFVNFSTKNYKVFILGKAKNRDTLLLFKKNIESDACFSGVTLPLSDLVVKENIEFQIEFSINQDCLKKQ